MSYDKSKLVVGYTGEFVIHNHHSSHHHWDLRLEFPVLSSESLEAYTSKRTGNTPEPKADASAKSVLRSWAIPKHQYPEDKALLAIEVEDHDFEYRKFEGTIPEGNYGAGTVEIEDSGNFVLLKVDHSTQQYVFLLNGKKTKRYFNLFRIGEKRFLWVRVNDPKKYQS